ncbi:MotA/TolQ/ExbB proton channel family protein [Tundrisphaera sp. TA3]|uniref:MotA/TolQ/ExbB proton channel family protein n=1 Tax=Tundrisphaera sp. TA3 TaxID=3435775 RepID=UPI003EC11905
MHRTTNPARSWVRAASGLALVLVVVAGGADGAPAAGQNPTLDLAMKRAEAFGREASAWFRRTPPADRVTWGGLGACAVLGLLVLAERSLRLRSGRVTPREFSKRFRERLQDGKLDRGKALDLCELNPSPAARVALAAVRRWGRPVADIERAVALACRVETDLLRRNVGTLRRVAAMTPLLGLLGSLISAGRALTVQGASWGPALGQSLIPLTSGVALAIIALVAYDGLVGKVEKLANTLDRLGAETVDAIAMSAPVETATHTVHTPRGPEPRRGPIRTPHQIRVEIPDSLPSRSMDRDDLYDDD